MEFKANIYIKDEGLPFYKRWSNSDLLLWSSFFFLMFSISILMSNQKYFNDNEIIKSIFTAIAIISCFVWIYSSIIRFWEFEKVNGKFENEISFKEKGIQVNQTLFIFRN